LKDDGCETRELLGRRAATTGLATPSSFSVYRWNTAAWHGAELAELLGEQPDV